MKKNTTGQQWRVFAFTQSTGAPLEGDSANITAQLAKDYGAEAAVTDTNPTEVGGGYYDFDLSQAETNADVLELRPASATSGVSVVPCPARFDTTFPQTGDSYARLGAPAGLSVSADILAAKGATFNTSTDSLEAIRNRGDEAWTTGGASGEGAYTGTLTINDGSTGLQGAVVNARRGGVLIATGTTNASGKITDWVFDAHTYDLSVRLSGYQPETDTIAVTGDAWSKTISLDLLASLTPPSSPSLCTVGFCVRLGTTPVQGAVCKGNLLGVNHASDGTILSNEPLSATTDADGLAELSLVRSDQITKGTGKYAISVSISGQPIASVETTIPAAATCYFEDLLT